MEHQNDGVKVRGRIVQALRFAENKAMVANSNAGKNETQSNKTANNDLNMEHSIIRIRHVDNAKKR